MRRNMLSRRPSPAMSVALLALFVALGGSGYAAVQLPKNSVGPKHKEPVAGQTWSLTAYAMCATVSP